MIFFMLSGWLLMSKIEKFLKIACIIASLASQTLVGAPFIWQGTSTSEDLETAVNWNPNGNPGTIPSAGTSAQFDSTATGQAPTLSTTGEAFSVDLITFPSGAPQYTFTINGSGATFTLVGSSLNPAGVQNSSGLAQTFNVSGSAQMTFENSSSADVGNSGLVDYNIGSSTTSTSGSIVFTNSSMTGAAVISAIQGSDVTFTNSSTGSNLTNVTLNTGSTLSTDHSLTLGALNVVDTASKVMMGGTLTVGTTGNQTIAGVISNGSSTIGSLNKVGSGTLTLTADNTYTGGTTVTAGTLELSNSSILGNVNIASGATLDIEVTTGTETYAGQITGAGNVEVNQTTGNTGTIILSGLTGTGNYTGTTSVGAGTLEFNNSSAMTLSGGISISTGASVDFEQAATTTANYLGQLTGGGNVVVNQAAGNTGTVILSGTNGYTGATTISDGTLQINSSGSLISSTSGYNINNSAAVLDFEQVSGSGAFSGVISGAGKVNINTVAGSIGRVILGNASNSYTGATTIAGGILQLNSSGATISPSSSINISNSAASLDIEQSSGIGSYNSVINGPGNLLVNTASGSTGTVVLGQPQYTGTTTLLGGGLQFNAMPLSSSISMANNANVGFNSSGTFSGQIIGEGSLTSNPGIGGSVVLNGLKGISYTGATTISSGTLLFDNISSTPTIIPGNIFLNGNGVNPVSLDLEQAPGTFGIYGGNISGNGSLLVNTLPQDTGTVILQGLNTYSNGTIVQAGTLQGNSNSLQGMINNNAAVTFNQTTNGIFNGTLIGPASSILYVTGPGTLTFATNNSSFLGTTNIQQGNLDLENQLGGNVFVQIGGLLSGNGTILGNLIVNNGGVVRPDPNNLVGIITVDNNYVQNSGSIYNVVLAQDQSSLLNVLGTATLNPGSAVNVTKIGDAKVEEPYTILSAAQGLSGTFTTVTSSSPLLIPTITYDPTHAFLTLQVQFSVITETYNQRQVAKQLESITNPTASEEAVLEALLNLSFPDGVLGIDPRSEFAALHALDQMSAQQYTNLVLTAELANRQFIRRMFDPLRSLIITNPCYFNMNDCQCSYGPVVDIWGSAEIGKSFLTGTRNARSVRLSEYEFSVGAQIGVGDFGTLGGALSYELDHISYNVGGSGNSHRGLGGIYGLYRPACFYLLGELAIGYSRERMTRHINIGPIHLRAFSRPNIFQSTFYFEWGKDYIFNSMLIQPFIGFEAGCYYFKQIDEHGAHPLDVIVSRKAYSPAYSLLGVHLTTKALPCHFWMGIDLAWQYRLTSSPNHIRERFKNFGGKFTIKGIKLDQNSIWANVRLAKNLGARWGVFAEMSGQSWQNAFSYSFIGGIQTSW